MKKPLILCYGVDDDTSAGIKKLAKPLGVSLLRVAPSAYALPLAAVVAGVGAKGNPPESALLPEPMLLFANLPQGMLEVLLDAMRRKGLRVSLKAILTPHNAAWTAYELYHELCAERKALSHQS